MELHADTGKFSDIPNNVSWEGQQRFSWLTFKRDFKREKQLSVKNKTTPCLHASDFPPHSNNQPVTNHHTDIPWPQVQIYTC